MISSRDKSERRQKKALKGYSRYLYGKTERNCGMSREDKSTANIMEKCMTQGDGEAYLRTSCGVCARVTDL